MKNREHRSPGWENISQESVAMKKNKSCKYPA